MGGYNRVILIGHLGRDPETRATPSGRVVVTFSLATNRAYKDKDGQTQKQVEWHRIVGYGRVAEIVRDHLRKGREVCVEGRLQTREWQDKDGHRRWTTEVILENLQFLGGGRRDEAPALDGARSGPQEAEVPF
jgi:single-strand DNA-binding protein